MHTRFILPTLFALGALGFLAGCGGGGADEAASAESVGEGLEPGSIEAGPGSESPICVANELRCEMVGELYVLEECAADEMAFETVQNCTNSQVCDLELSDDLGCVDRPACSVATCEVEGEYCPTDYPRCPYGIEVGDIAPPTSFIDPNSGDALHLSEHYGLGGHLALIAANGW